MTEADVVCFLDGDTADPDPRHLQGLIGPLLLDTDLVPRQGCFRPAVCRAGGVELPHEGRTRDRTDGAAATEPPRAAARRLLAAAGGGVCRPAGAASADSRFPPATASRSRCSSMRLRPLRARRAGRVPPRRAPEPPPAAARRSARWPTPCWLPSSGGSVTAGPSSAATTYAHGRTGPSFRSPFRSARRWRSGSTPEGFTRATRPAR